MFCEMAVTKCENLKCIKLTTNKDTRSNSEQTAGLEQLAESLLQHHVTLIVEYLTNLHDRQVM